MSETTVRPEHDETPASNARISVLLSRRTLVGAAWLTSVVVAACLGWFAATVAPPAMHRAPTAVDSTIARVQAVPLEYTPTAGDERSAVVERDSASGPDTSSLEAPSPSGSPAPSTALSAPPTQASTKSSLPVPAKPATPSHDTAPAIEPRPATEPTADALPTEALPIEPPPPDALTLAVRANELAEAGDIDAAREQAASLLADQGSYTELLAAMDAEGAGQTQARLNAVRVLQLAGEDDASIELARELKRTYAASPEVLKTISDWHLLSPRITSVDPSIADGAAVVVTGQVDNPDLGDVRRVVVEVEALDAAGNVLATERARVRPKTLRPGDGGSFSVRFGGVDPKSVLRTRATVVEWESEVYGAG